MNDEERRVLLERLTEIKAELERLKAENAEEASQWSPVDILLFIALGVALFGPVIALICKVVFAEPSETPEICRMLSSTNTSVWVKDSRYKEIPGPAIIVVKDTDKAKDKADASDIK